MPGSSIADDRGHHKAIGSGLSHMTNEGEGWYRDYGGPLSAGFSVEAAMEELEVRTAVLNDTLEDAFGYRYPGPPTGER